MTIRSPTYQQAKEWPRWQPPDTSRGTPQTLRPAGALPPGRQQVESAPQFRGLWPPADTSRGTPKPLLPEVRLPAGAQQTFTAPDRVRQISDTTLGSPRTLAAPPAPRPFSSPIQFGPDRIRPVADTSASSPIVLLSFVAPARPPGAQNYVPPAEFKFMFEPHNFTLENPALFPVPPAGPLAVRMHRRGVSQVRVIG